MSPHGRLDGQAMSCHTPLTLSRLAPLPLGKALVQASTCANDRAVQDRGGA